MPTRGTTLGLKIDATQNATQVFADVERSFERFARNFGATSAQAATHAASINGSIGSIGAIASGVMLGTVLPALTSGLFNMGIGAFAATANYERLSLSLDQLLAREIRAASGTEKEIVTGYERIAVTEKSTAETEKAEAAVAKATQTLAKEEEQLVRLKQRQAELQNSVQDHARDLATANRTLDEARKKYGENSKQVQVARDRVADLNDQYFKLNNTIRNVNVDIDTQTKKIGSTSDEIGDLTAKQKELTSAGEKLVPVTKKIRDGQMTLTEAMKVAKPQTKELLGWLQKLAIESPFTMDTAAKSYQMAMSFGFASTEAKDLTGTLIDWAAGAGKSGEEMERVAYALGQVKALGRLAGQEVLQLANAGVPIREMLAESMGITTEEVMKLQESGKLLAKDVLPLITKKMKEDFGGAAKAQTHTLTGMISTFNDIATIGQRELFGGIFKAAQPYLIRFVDKLADPKFFESLNRIGEILGVKVVNALRILTNLANAFKLPEIAKKVLAMFEGKASLKDVIMLQFSGLKEGLTKVIQNIPWSAIGQLAVELFTAAMTEGAILLPKVQAWLQTTWNSIPWETVWGAVNGFIDTAKTWLQGQFALIPWDQVWAAAGQTISSGIGLGWSILGKLEIWLAEQVRKIDWNAVWNKVQDIGRGFVEGASMEAKTLTGWLREKILGIDWNDVWTGAKKFGEGFAQWAKDNGGPIAEGIKEIFLKVKWEEIGANFKNAINNLFMDMGTTGDNEKAGSAIGNTLKGAITSGLKTIAEVGGAVTSAIGGLIAGIDWYKMATGLGPNLIMFIIGFVDSLFDLEAWWSVIQKNWFPLLMAVITLMFTPVKILAPLFKALRAIPFVGPLISWFLMGAQKILGPIGMKIGGWFKAVLGLITEGWGTNLVRYLREGLPAIFKLIDFFKALVLRIRTGAGEWIWNAISALRSGFQKNVVGLLGHLIRAFFAPIEYAFRFIAYLFKNGKTVLPRIWEEIGAALSRGWHAVVEWFQGGWSRLTEFWNTVKGVARGAWEGLAERAGAIWDGLATGARSAWDWLVGLFEKGWSKVGDLIDGAKNVWKGVSDFFAEKASGIGETVGRIWGRVKGFIDDFIEKVKTDPLGAIKDAITGILNFMAEKIDAIKKAANLIVLGAIAGFRDTIREWKPPIPTISVEWVPVNIMGINTQKPNISVGLENRRLGDMFPWLASGGIANMQTLAMLGERGREAVLPLDGYQGQRTMRLLAQGMMQAAVEMRGNRAQVPTEVHVHIHGGMSVRNDTDLPRLARQVAQEIRRHQR